MIKRIASIFFAVSISLFGLSACSSGTEETAAITEADCGTEGAFCIGLVTDTGKVDDKSFNQSA
jgi:basic membrane protein A